MTTKFKKSNISVSGEIGIHIPYERNGFTFSGTTVIELKPLSQSKSGVYCLRNKLNGRLYIGMASNLERRKWRHWNDLIMGKHINKLLLQDYMSSPFTRPLDIGLKSEVDELFEFEVIIYCYPSQLTFWEGLLIDNLKPYYNVKKKKEIAKFEEFLGEIINEE